VRVTTLYCAVSSHWDYPGSNYFTLYFLRALFNRSPRGRTHTHIHDCLYMQPGIHSHNGCVEAANVHIRRQSISKDHLHVGQRRIVSLNNGSKNC